jgi:hypothetical protein
LNSDGGGGLEITPAHRINKARIIANNVRLAKFSDNGMTSVRAGYAKFYSIMLIT